MQLALGERPDTDWAGDPTGIEYTLVSGIQPVLPHRLPPFVPDGRPAGELVH